MAQPRGLELALIRIQKVKVSESQVLDLSGLELVHLPDELWELELLEKLDLSRNQLSFLPDAIGQLQNLRELWLWGNLFKDFPITLSQLRNLQYLNLSRNRLSSLPNAIGQLRNLQYLNLADNQLTTLPPEIGQLQNLQRLDLSDNQLTTLPPEIGQLQNLQRLNLRNNNLTTLPSDLDRLTGLERLNLHGNPLTLTLPSHLLGGEFSGGNAQALLDFYRAVWERGQPWGQVRVLFVGQPGVGKTQLIRRLKDLPFEENSSSTMTIETHNLLLGDYTAHIWDFGGQEFMHATHPFFFSQRCIYVLVLNVRHDLENNRVRYWLNLIRAYGGDSPVIIVGNHADADQHTLDLPFNTLQREYRNIQTYVQTSAKEDTGTEDLRKALETAARDLPHVRVLFAASHLAVRDALEEEKGHREIIPWERYREICREQGITDERDQNLLLDLLHDLGVVLAFRNEQGEPLTPEGVLNPNWVTRAVYRILTDQEVRSRTWGRVNRALVKRILSDYQPWQRDLIMKLMQKFELAYPAGDGVWWIPSVMRQDEPDAAREEAWEDALVFEYEYEPDFYDSIITRFIVRTYEHIDDNLVWRYGVILRLQNGENRVLVRADKQGKRLEIRVTGRSNTRREALAFVREHLEAIHATFARGKGETSFQVTAYILPAEYPGLRLRYDDLLTFEKDGVEWFHANWQGRTVRLRVREVLDGFISPQERLEELKRRFPEEAKRIEQIYHIQQAVIVEGNVDHSTLAAGQGNRIEQHIEVNPALGQEVAQALVQLAQAVQAMLPHLEPGRQEEVLEELQRLKEELRRSKPRRRW